MLNELVWNESLAIDSFGFKVGVRTNRAELMPSIRESLPPGWRECKGETPGVLYSLFTHRRLGPAGDVYALYADGERLIRSRDCHMALDFLERQVEQQVAEFSPDYVFVHAGVVGWKGRAIVLPGKTFSGKSTLVAALVRAGAVYYSDEFAVVSAEGLVYPYARKISLRDDQARGVRYPPLALGGTIGTEAIPVGLVISSAYVADTELAAKPMSAGETVMALLGNALCARSRPVAAMAHLSRAARSCEAWKITRGEADAAAAYVLALAEGVALR